MSAYYNEIDPGAAAWLRELIKAGSIAPGDVDERDIRDVCPGDLTGYTQCHFFAGIGVWSYALRRAGWPDDEPVWTGSCPCQPFSAAGRGAGFADERHLWPAYYHLISQREPPVLFGEQVASQDGLAWFDLVQADMEGAGYACGVVDSCAAGFGAPHIRQRLYFVADAAEQGRQPRRGAADQGDGCRPARIESGRLRDAGKLGHAERARLEGLAGHGDGQAGWPQPSRPIAPAGVVGGFWDGAELIYCRDDKWRPIEPGTFPLAHGAPARVGRLRGYGNAIVADQAKEIIMAYMDTKLTSAERSA